MDFRTSVTTLFVFWALLLMGWAGVIPGRWEKVDSLASGTEVIVVLESGETIEGTYLKSDEGSVHLGTSPVIERTFPKTSISRVVSRQKVDDRLRNGTLIGAGLGFGAGFLALVAYNKSETASGSIWGGESNASYLGAGLVGAGVGAAAGAVIDKLHKTPEEFYRSR